MSLHPEDDLVLRCLIGEAGAEDREHLRSCAACRLECERFEGAFTAFRGSVRQWSEHEFAAVIPALRTDPRSISGGAWIMAFLLLAALAGWKVALDGNSVRPSPVAVDRDAALLEYVNNDVARPVPSGMEPLLTLVSR